VLEPTPAAVGSLLIHRPARTAFTRAAPFHLDDGTIITLDQTAAAASVGGAMKAAAL
jgi:hypothetical protein